MLAQTFNKLKHIQNVTQLKLPLLFFGFAVWVSFPIVGIFPLLLTIQLDLLRVNKRTSNFLSLNNLILLLVVLTVAIYVSSFDVFADTKVYLDIYNNLDRNSPWDNRIAQQRFEVGLFLFFSVIHYLSNESTFWCLFAFALFNNSIIVFYISKKLSPRYYPTLLIILFSTYFYYSQVFYMRQFMALVFVLAAIINMESSLILFSIFSILAVFSHTTSVIYIFLAIFTQLVFIFSQWFKKIKWDKKDKMLVYLILIVILIILIYVGLQIYDKPTVIYKYVNNIIDYVPQEQVSRSLQTRVENNDQRDIDSFEITIFRTIAIASLGTFMLARSHQKISPKILSLIAIYIVSLLQILFILVTGFNQRIVYLFLAFYGLFFCIGLDDKKLSQTNKIKNFALVSAITIFMAAANVFNFTVIQVNMGDIVGWSFFDKQPMSMSLFDYIIYFWQSM